MLFANSMPSLYLLIFLISIEEIEVMAKALLILVMSALLDSDVFPQIAISFGT